MFDLDAVTVSTHERGGAGQLLGEVVATFGLVLVVFGSLRSARVETVAFAVGGYIAAAYWFTSSTSFANPAVTIARTLSDTFAGIAPASVPPFVLMQLRRRRPRRVALILLLHPRRPGGRDDQARPSCSSASTTPAAPRWPPATCSTSPATGSRCSRPARSRPTRSTRSPSRRWPRRASTSPARSRSCSPTPRSGQSDVVVTMGCGDECPFFPGKRYEDWVLDDPAGQDIEMVRAVRDEIRRRVEALIRGAARRAAPCTWTSDGYMIGTPALDPGGPHDRRAPERRRHDHHPGAATVTHRPAAATPTAPTAATATAPTAATATAPTATARRRQRRHRRRRRPTAPTPTS